MAPRPGPLKGTPYKKLSPAAKKKAVAKPTGKRQPKRPMG